MKLVLIGAGQRGMNYARYAFAKGHPIMAVAEPNDARRAIATAAFGIPDHLCFRTGAELLAHPRMGDAAIIATMDRDHGQEAIPAMRLGYDLLLEKPISPDPLETLAIADTARQTGRRVVICHVLRYAPFFRQIKQILDSGELGRIVAIDHTENIGNYHMAHSFVRGNWRNTAESSPILLQKSCHDLDLLLWLTGRHVRRVFSVGALSFFRPENAPQGSAARCVDCPVAEGCRFDARRVYLPIAGYWPATAVTEDQTEAGLLRALQTGPYGRCVYRCDNDVCDHQSVAMEFEDGATAVFTLCGMTDQIHRTIHIMCEHGELWGDDGAGTIRISRFRSSHTDTMEDRCITMGRTPGGHGGGDQGLMEAFLADPGEGDRIVSDVARSVESHLLAFAAEESRLTGRGLEMRAFENQLRLRS